MAFKGLKKRLREGDFRWKSFFLIFKKLNQAWKWASHPSTSVLLHLVAQPYLHSNRLEIKVLSDLRKKMKLIDATAIGLLSQSLLIYNELKPATELNWSQGSYPLSPSVTLYLPQWKNPLPHLLSDLESACLLPFKFFLGDLKKFYFFCFFTGEL